MKKEVIANSLPKSPISETFRALRTNIQYMSAKSDSQTMLVTSTMQGEGKSWIVSNLAVTFAQVGKNVVIVDSDMRRPRQNVIFSCEMYPGLSNYLSGVNQNGIRKNITVKECIRTTEVEGLYILPAGNVPPNPSELIASERTTEMIETLKNIFDIIIFDGAPCLLVTDSTILSRMVDSTIIVASAKMTKAEDLIEAKRKIENVGGHISGVVLNRVVVSSKKYENKYYYRKNKHIVEEETEQISEKNSKTNASIKKLDELEKAKKKAIEQKTQKLEITNSILDEINKYTEENK